MTATVLPFKARKSSPAPCACPRHELDRLADRVRAVLDDHAGGLLIPLPVLEDVLADLTATTGRLLPPTTTERNTQP